MKEILNQKLANPSQTPYPIRYGDIFMAGESDMPQPNQNPQNPEHSENLPHRVDEATRRLKIAAEAGKQAGEQAAARKVLENLKDSPVDVGIRRALEEAAGIRGTTDRPSIGSKEQAPAVKTGRATWRSKNNDQPVNVIGYLGKGSDGRDYVSIEGNATGIPLDEIQFPTESQPMATGGASAGGDQPTPETSADASGAGVPPGRGGEGMPPAPPFGPSAEQPQEPAGEDNAGPKPPSTENINFENLSDENPLKNLLEAYSRQLGKGILDSNVSSINDYIKSVNEIMSNLSPQERQMATLFMSRLEDYIGEINQYEIEAKRLSEGKRLIRDLHVLHEWSRREIGQGGVGLSRLLTDRAYRDEVFNRLFASVEATPHQQFREAFNPLTYGKYYEVFMDIMREASTDMKKIVEDYGDILDLENTSKDSDSIKEAKRKIQQALLGGDEKISFEKELKDDFRRYQLERQARETLHDVNTLIYLPSIQMKGLAESAYMQQFSTQLADFAQKTPGVKEMMDIYEAQLRESMRQHDGFLPTEEVIGKVTRGVKGNPIDVGLSHIEVETKRIFREKIRKGLVTIRILDLDDGVLKPEPIAAELPDWEIDRTFSVARGMMLVNLRLVSIAAESKLAGHGGRFASVFLQDVLQSYSPYRHLIAKYGVVESAIAALMHTPQGEKGNWFVDFFKSRHPKELKKILEKFEAEDKTPKEKQEAFDDLLYAGDVMRYVMKQNPNRAGDLYTFFTWRGGSDGEHVNPASITEEFIQEGKERMIPRLKKKYEIGTVDLKEKAAGIDYGKDPSETDIITKNIAHFRSPATAGIDIDVIKSDVKEYVNWVGTALRLEMLRGDLEKEIGKTHKGESYAQYILDKNKGKEVAKRKESWKIVERMVRFQPHRLFEVSEEIRKRIKEGEGLTGEEKKKREEMLPKIPKILEYLSDIETAILRDREKILDTDVKTFKDIDLSDKRYFVPEYIDNTDLVKPEDRDAIKDFIEAVKTDFESKPENYWKEFISQREYTHGFVLWTGDCPVDEFNMQALGQTGAIARRARDNNQQAEAMNKEIALLKNLKNIRTPDEVIAALHEIYEPIQGYDAGKAKQAIAEKVEGIIKFYSGDWLSRLPIIGILRDQFGVSSLAQALHGKEAPVWKANEIRYLLTQLKNKEMINKIQFKRLADKTLSTKKDVVIDTATFAGTFLSIAMLWYMINKISKEEK